MPLSGYLNTFSFSIFFKYFLNHTLWGITFSTAFNYLNILFAAILRGLGNTRLAFGVSLLMNALNVVFNYGLILGNYGLPALGVEGAALGTGLADTGGRRAGGRPSPLRNPGL